METSQRTIRLACVKHGAQTVLDAAHKRIAGDRLALLAVGLADTLTVDEAYIIGMTCFALMADARRAVYPMPLFRWTGGHGAGTATDAHPSALPPLFPVPADSRV